MERLRIIAFGSPRDLTHAWRWSHQGKCANLTTIISASRSSLVLATLENTILEFDVMCKGDKRVLL